MNNYERIKNMSLDEIALFVEKIGNNCHFCVLQNLDCIGNNCKEGIKQWLLSESEEYMYLVCRHCDYLNAKWNQDKQQWNVLNCDRDIIKGNFDNCFSKLNNKNINEIEDE